MEAAIDKALLIAVYPFFALMLICFLVWLCARGGRPVSLKLKGLGISFELNSTKSVDAQSPTEKET